MVAKYIYNKTIKQLVKNHEYEILLSKHLGKYVYDCHIIADITSGEQMDLWLQFSSELNIKNYFNIERIEVED